MSWLVLLGAVMAEDGSDDEVVIEAEREPDSATSRSLDRDAIEAMPGHSADDLLRAMPGLHQSAHGGHGKAYQYFLRGFDAVHGADLAVDVEGVPVNEVSNVHAHGYLDLHFIPTALVRGVDLWPGTWRPESGDFAVAGSASFRLGLEEPGALLIAGSGTDRSGEAALAWRPTTAKPGTFLTVDGSVGEGIGMARSWRQVRAGGGAEGQLGDVSARAWLLAYDGVFESPGVLRGDDLLAGAVDFYDAYPGSGGGHSARVLGSVQLLGGGRVPWQATGWAGWRDFSVRQNFTGWYDDATHGDGTRQDYTAWSMGASGRTWWQPVRQLSVLSGAVVRLERLEQSEHAIGSDESIQADLSALQGHQIGGSLWLSIPMEVARWLSVSPGLRGEIAVLGEAGESASRAPVAAPKLSMVIAEDADLTGFFGYGRGFRSPDIRGTGGGGRAPVSLSDSVETGAIFEPLSWLSLRAAGFATRVSDEIVFDHVSARYLATGSTRRLGVDAGLTVRPIDPIRLETGVTWSDGRYTASREPIPYAPRLLVVSGLYAERLLVGALSLTGGLRLWVLGPRPLPDGFFSATAAVPDLTCTVRRGAWGATLEVDSLLNTEWRDGEFVFPSRWDPDAPLAELPVRHFTAGTPRALHLALSRRL